MAGTGRFALFVIAATTRIRSPGATESGIPSTVNATANPVTCTSFVTVLLKVGVRMPTSLAASRTATKKAARGPILIPSRIDHTSPAPPGRAFSTGPSRRDKEGSCMHRARRRIRAEAVTLFEGLGCPMPMKIAVLGARGLLGGAVARRARLAAHQDGRVDLGLPRYPDVYGPGAIHADFRPVFEGALANKPCRWPLNADALHEFILNDDAAEAMLKLIGTPAAHGRAVHVPGPRAIVSRDFIRLVYAAAGSGEPIVRVFGRGMYRLVGLFSPMARAAYEMAYLFDDPILLDGTLYRSLTRGPHPSTPYEVGVPRTLEWFRTHRAIA